MNRKYSGFTLVEMLIVMGIIIILMVVGITAGRFAINRANDVAHKNSVDQVFVSLQAYYTDEQEYPVDSIADTDCVAASGICTFDEMVGDSENQGLLVPYIDAFSFDGSSKASFFYGVGGDGDNQSALVCVTLRGPSSENNTHPNGAVYCSGNGIGDATIDWQDGTANTAVPISEMVFEDSAVSYPAAWAIFADGGSEWDQVWQ